MTAINNFSAVWVNPRFLHYRVPVYCELNNLLKGKLSVIYSAERVPSDVQEMLHEAIGNNAIPLHGEKQIKLQRKNSDFSNLGLLVPWQPGLIVALRAIQPDVIIAEGFFQWSPAAFWMKLTSRIPIVVAYERTEHTERKAGKLRLLYRKLAAKYTDSMIVNGVLSKEYLHKELKVPEDHIVTGAMTADTESLSNVCRILDKDRLIKIERSLGLQRPVFLVVGRIVKPKGVWELIESWGKYSNGESGLIGSLLLVGDGPDKQDLENMCNDRKIPGVFFAGPVNHQEIADYYALCDILISPTLEDNWSLVVHEAMACAKPIICSCYNGCWPELVREEVNGWIYDPLKNDELVNLLKLCVAHQNRLRFMGEKSREIAKNFSSERAARATLEACRIALWRSKSKISS